MILYNPISGDVQNTPVRYLTKTCFLMRQLRNPIQPILEEMSVSLTSILSEYEIKVVDASSETTGRDFLYKIWQIMVSVPIGIALIQKGISKRTMANIFYELGLMQALGKETLVIKSCKIKVPSDFVRTEYVDFDEESGRKIRNFISSLQKQAKYYVKVASSVENNPLLAIDYLRRAYLLTGENQLKEKAGRILREANLSGRAKNSVEMLLASFIDNVE